MRSVNELVDALEAAAESRVLGVCSPHAELLREAAEMLRQPWAMPMCEPTPSPEKPRKKGK